MSKEKRAYISGWIAGATSRELADHSWGPESSLSSLAEAAYNRAYPGYFLSRDIVIPDWEHPHSGRTVEGATIPKGTRVEISNNGWDKLYASALGHSFSVQATDITRG